MEKEEIILIVPAEMEGMRLDQFLADQMSFSRS